MTSVKSQKPRFLALPSESKGNRLRSRTLTTPVCTPAEGLSEFITKEQLLKLETPTGRHWDCLSTEIKSHVLSFLSATDRIRCMLVNREICSLITDGALWQTLDASSFYSKIPAPQLMRLLERSAPFVQDLNLRGCSQLRPCATQGLNNLIRASFEGCRLLPALYLDHLVSSNMKLRHLNISGLSVVNDDTMLAISRSCRMLESIDVSYCKQISEAGLYQLLANLPCLSDVRIAECKIAQRTCTALNQLKQLRRLSLAGCSDLQDSWLKDLIYGDLGYGLIFPETRFRSSLVHLNLSRCPNLTTDCLRYLCWVMPNLQKLELSGMAAMTDAGLTGLLPTLPSLTHIDLEESKITDQALFSLAACENVRHVQLSHCSHIRDAGVLALVEQLSLNHLDLDNTRISDRVLSAIAMRPQQMRLSIYDCPNLSWTGVLSLLTANSTRPGSLKRVKTFYGWQRPVDGHTKRCSRGDLQGAKVVEREWAAYMMGSSEELLKTGEGRTRFLDFDDEEARIVARERRGSRACIIM